MGVTLGELRQLISEFDLPIATWDQVGSAIERWEPRGMSRIHRKYWEVPWDRDEADRLLQGIDLQTDVSAFCEALIPTRWLAC